MADMQNKLFQQVTKNESNLIQEIAFSGSH